MFALMNDFIQSMHARCSHSSAPHSSDPILLFPFLRIFVSVSILEALNTEIASRQPVLIFHAGGAHK